MRVIIHMLNLEIDKFKLAHGRKPSVMRLGRKQMTSLLQLHEESGAPTCGTVNYQEIPIEEVDADWFLACGELVASDHVHR